MTRRDSLKLIGLSATSTVLPRLASADVPTFPGGTVIRTILKDYAPGDLAGGATLFHEHMSQQADFLPSMGRIRNAGDIRAGAFETVAPPPSPPAGTFYMRDEDLMTAEMSAARSEGIACIVDASDIQ